MASLQTSSHNAVKILLVEDDEADIVLTKQALAKAKLANQLFVVRDGVKAMRFLRCEGEFAESPTPDLILLDLNMPRKDGRAVLEEMNADVVLKQIPTVILTSSPADQDLVTSFDLHPNAYVVKPSGFTEFVEVVTEIMEIWLELPVSNASGAAS